MYVVTDVEYHVPNRTWSKRSDEAQELLPQQQRIFLAPCDSKDLGVLLRQVELGKISPTEVYGSRDSWIELVVCEAYSVHDVLEKLPCGKQYSPTV